MLCAFSLELFLVLYPSISSPLSLSSPATFLHSILPVSLRKFWPKLCHLITYLRFFQFQIVCKTTASPVSLKQHQIVHHVWHNSVCIRLAEYVQIHWEQASPKATPSHRDKWVSYVCSVLLLKSPLHQNHLLHKI